MAQYWDCRADRINTFINRCQIWTGLKGLNCGSLSCIYILIIFCMTYYTWCIIFSISVHECAVVNEEAISKSSHIYTLSSAQLTTTLVISEREISVCIYVCIYLPCAYWCCVCALLTFFKRAGLCWRKMMYRLCTYQPEFNNMRIWVRISWQL